MSGGPAAPRSGSDDAPGPTAYIHAVAVVISEHGLLIRGASGSGKSTLASSLAAEARRLGWFGRLVADDTVGLGARGGRLVARAHPLTAGMAERRGVGIVAIAHEAASVVRLVVDLVGMAELIRLPEPRDASVRLIGIALPRLVVPAGAPVGDNVYRVMDCLAAFRP